MKCGCCLLKPHMRPENYPVQSHRVIAAMLRVRRGDLDKTARAMSREGYGTVEACRTIVAEVQECEAIKQHAAERDAIEHEEAIRLGDKYGKEDP